MEVAVPSCACGPLAQLARALASHARGHWFESSTVHYSDQRICLILVIRRLRKERREKFRKIRRKGYEQREERRRLAAVT